MKEKFLLNSDGVCVYVSVGISSLLWGKVLLLLANSMVIAVLIFAIITWIPGLLLFNIALLGWLLKYTLWNIYGQEHLIINTKSVSHQHDYGFIRTAYKTVPFESKLKILVQPSNQPEDKHLVLQFVSHDSNDLPILIYQMALSVSEGNALRIRNMVKQLYVDKLSDEYQMPFVNLN